MRSLETTPARVPGQSSQKLLAATPMLPSFSSAYVLDSPGKLTASTRSTVAPHTPLRAGYSSLSSSVRSYAEPECEPVATDVTSWDQAGVRRSVRSKVGSPRRNSPPKASSPRWSPRSSSPSSASGGPSPKQLANRSTSRHSLRSSPRSPPRAAPRTILQSTGGPLVKPAQAPATFDQPRKSVAAKLPPRAKSCSQSRSPSPRRKCEGCCPVGDHAKSSRPGFLHGQLIEPSQRCIQGQLSPGHLSQMLAAPGMYRQLAGAPAYTTHAPNHGIVHACSPMEASELDAHIDYCEGIRAAVGEITKATLQDMKMHADHLCEHGIDAPGAKTDAVDEDTDVWPPKKSKARRLSARSTDSAVSDREKDDCWHCCKDTSQKRGRSARKLNKSKESSYGVAVSL